MNRRTFLTSVAVGGVAGVAGCVSSTNPGTGGETTTDDSPTEQSPTLTNKSFTVVSEDCGNEVSKANVSFQPDQSQVQVSGTIFGPSACYTGKLDSATYDGESDTLNIHVVTEQPDEDAMCAQCIQEIQYQASIGFENGLPETVVVTHTTGGEDHEVARASQSA
ncbi:twin-arginine translocation signal domain-containing protein [Haladaptatus sp. CMSO5]|uniref:twin-arginine translocation signal domain-containing protein n=1 Tax=Haladaptatus sp. CMSO5 TaxID=3120514 RepID=UPI002FCE4098